MKLFLDTNVYSDYLRGPSALDAYIEDAASIVLSAITVGELEQGFRYGSRYEQNLEVLDRFLEEPRVSFLPISRRTARRYGMVWGQLKRKGRPIPSNDIWLAAQTMESEGTLISSDGHFQHIEGLDWIHPEQS